MGGNIESSIAECPPLMIKCLAGQLANVHRNQAELPAPAQKETVRVAKMEQSGTVWLLFPLEARNSFEKKNLGSKNKGD